MNSLSVCLYYFLLSLLLFNSTPSIAITCDNSIKLTVSLFNYFFSSSCKSRLLFIFYCGAGDWDIYNICFVVYMGIIPSVFFSCCPFFTNPPRNLFSTCEYIYFIYLAFYSAKIKQACSCNTSCSSFRNLQSFAVNFLFVLILDFIICLYLNLRLTPFTKSPARTSHTIFLL